MNINNLTGLEKPLIKFIEVVSSGIGKIYEPIHIERKAKAKAKELEIMSEIVNKNISLPIKYEKGDITIDTEKAQELISRAQNRMLYQEMKKQQNIDSIVEKAYVELEKEKEVSSEPVDEDWIIRFFNSIEDIKEEEMQELWAKILAGEIKQPKSFSKRTLEVLRNISKEEALLFEKICKTCIGRGDRKYFINYSNLLNESSISFSEILQLSEAGLIEGRGDISTKYVLKNEPVPILDNSKLLIFASKDINEGNKTLNIPTYPLTSSGTELAQIFKFDITEEFLIKIVKEVKDQNRNLKMSIHRIIFENGNGVKYDKTNLLENI